MHECVSMHICLYMYVCLAFLAEVVTHQCERTLVPCKEAIPFVKSSAPVKHKSHAKLGPQLVSSKGGWKLEVDLHKLLVFSEHMPVTTQHSDMVLWSDSFKTVINGDEQYYRRMIWSEPLRERC